MQLNKNTKQPEETVNVYGLLKNSSTHDQRWKDKTREKVREQKQGWPKCKIPYARIWEVRALSRV
jgi:hypothetical protein